MENSKNKRRNCIQIYADEFPADVWETHCLACNVPYDASSITIWLDAADIEYERGGKEAAAGERNTGVKVKATVTFQKWEGDVARFNGEAEFDACDALDSLDDEMIALVEQGDPNAYDAVYYAAVRLGQIHGYDGPFEVDLDEDNLSDYLEARYPLEDEKEGE